MPDLNIDDDDDSSKQEDRDAKHDDLVGEYSLGHGAQDAPCFTDVVIGTMKSSSCMCDGFPLPCQVLKYISTKLLQDR